MCLAWQEILGYYEILRAEFPNARLQASRLDDYFDAAQVIRSRLPVVTSEIGDTWIQGVQSYARLSYHWYDTVY